MANGCAGDRRWWLVGGGGRKGGGGVLVEAEITEYMAQLETCYNNGIKIL